MKYAVIVEEGATSYGAFVPDLPGCVAVTETREDRNKTHRSRNSKALKEECF